jgi:hypothetical protein
VQATVIAKQGDLELLRQKTQDVFKVAAESAEFAPQLAGAGV